MMDAAILLLRKRSLEADSWLWPPFWTST